jgi:UDP-N-acetylglucosamine--N-acetylmuramyl-(pentapeptide) pyrophosphoryl-undecaprenol N-acetylglucosamine transferase
MVSLYEKTTLAVCRSGASTCSELGVFALPALLIPYPHAASDHQTANAQALEKSGAADVIQQRDMTVEWLKDYLAAQIADPERLRNMRVRSAARSVPLNAAEILAGVVEECARK